MTLWIQEEFAFYGNYVVTNCGCIISPRGKVLKQTITPKGYRTVGFIRNGGKSHCIPVHRLVALAFVANANPAKFNQINHIDGNPGNNTASNLEWCDNSHNNKEKFALRRRLGLPLHTPRELAAISRRRKARAA